MLNLDSKYSLAAAGTTSNQAGEHGLAAEPAAATVPSAVQLPRMPRGLALIRSRACYDAVATALRMAARVACSEDAPSESSSSTVALVCVRCSDDLILT